MHTAEAAAAPAAAPTAAPAAPGTFWQFFSKCSDPSRSDPSSLSRSFGPFSNSTGPVQGGGPGGHHDHRRLHCPRCAPARNLDTFDFAILISQKIKSS